jgi:hypothetical protein
MYKEDTGDELRYRLVKDDSLYNELLGTHHYIIIEPWVFTKNYITFKLWSDLDRF